MPGVRAVQAFTEGEAEAVQAMLTALVRVLRAVPGGGKLEEDYWSHIYHAARKAPMSGWSNLPMRDFVHEGLGVEMKLLRRRAPSSAQGKRLMHPSATRRIQFDPSEPAATCMTKVLEQFGREIADFRRRVHETVPEREPNIRWGVLLWSPSLDEFLYFETPMIEPDPAEFTATFEESRHRGRTTRSLYIFERTTGLKAYSVTMPSQGAKIQPYFDVPLEREGAHIFRIPTEELSAVWVAPGTLDALRASSMIDASAKLLPAGLDRLLRAHA
jgi:hypothetical protein